MAGQWLTRALDAIADRGLEIIRATVPKTATDNVAKLCRALLTGKGEAIGIALSREILARYGRMSVSQKLDFFHLLLDSFGADVETVRAAAEAYMASCSPANLQRLNQAIEPPRQELFRRLNMAPNGTSQLVAMRGDLLSLLEDHPELAPVEDDFRHILGSWFNRGFLRLESINWNTPARILEQLIDYESVHAIRDWNDLRRRLMDDRRCFAFFHPALPYVPLIFVEVALVKGTPRAVHTLLDPGSNPLPVAKADTAVFYSINSTLRGLRGISFGSFLIKQVLEEIRSELPWIETFVTLSPAPRFAATMRETARGEHRELANALERLLLRRHSELFAGEGEHRSSPIQRWLQRVQTSRGNEALSNSMRDLCLAYLTYRRADGRLLDPVAAFHLNNGARLERINTNADSTAARQKESFGCMVNYMYDPDEVERNHELFASGRHIPMSRSMARRHRVLSKHGLAATQT